MNMNPSSSTLVGKFKCAWHQGLLTGKYSGGGRGGGVGGVVGWDRGLYVGDLAQEEGMGQGWWGFGKGGSEALVKKGKCLSPQLLPALTFFPAPNIALYYKTAL